ncbi:hypothetical protein ACP4OV_018320 [Aristida adscensionis]
MSRGSNPSGPFPPRLLRRRVPRCSPESINRSQAGLYAIGSTLSPHAPPSPKAMPLLVFEDGVDTVLESILLFPDAAGPRSVVLSDIRPKDAAVFKAVIDIASVDDVRWNLRNSGQVVMVIRAVSVLAILTEQLLPRVDELTGDLRFIRAVEILGIMLRSHARAAGGTFFDNARNVSVHIAHLVAALRRQPPADGEEMALILEVLQAEVTQLLNGLWTISQQYP